MSQSFAEELSGVEKSHNLAVSLERAFDYARDGGQATVMLEHLLLALSEDSEAVGVLSACNVDLDRLRTDVAGHLGRMNGQSQGGQNEGRKLGQEPLADPLLLTIIRHASAAAQKSGRPQLNGAIVLAAIIGDGKSNAAQILEGQGLTFQGTLRALQAQGKLDASAAQSSPGQVASAKQAAPSPVPAPSPGSASSPAPSPSQSQSPAAGPIPSSTAGPASTQSPRPEPERATAEASQSVDDILGSVRERIKSKGTAPVQAQPDRVPAGAVKQGQQESASVAGQEAEGFPKILQQQAAEQSQSQSQSKSQSSSAPTSPDAPGSQKPARGSIGDGMPKIVSERMKKETADGPAPAPGPAPAQEPIRKPSPAPAVAAKPTAAVSQQTASARSPARSPALAPTPARTPAPAPSAAETQQPKPAPSPAPSPVPVSLPGTDAAGQSAAQKQPQKQPQVPAQGTTQGGGQGVRAKPVRPLAPAVQTDKWARAIDGKPQSSQTTQASPVVAQASQASPAPRPSQGSQAVQTPQAVQTGRAIQTAPSPTVAHSNQPGVNSGVAGRENKPVSPVPGAAPAYTGTYPEVARAGTATTTTAAPAPNPSQVAKPQSRPAASDIAGQNTGPPIEPWPEPRDPNKQPPPGAPPQSPPGSIAGQGAGGDLNTNPAGAPYLSAEEMKESRTGVSQNGDRGPSQVGGAAQSRGGVPAGRAMVAAKRKSGTQVGVGQLIENIPRYMRVAIPATIEVRIARDKVEALSEGMQGHAPVQRHDLFITKAMTVKLRAPDGGFWIETASPETQWIENTLGLLHDEFASWRWSVTPRARGSKRLQLVVSARTVGKDGLAAETPLPDQIITVKVRINYRQAFKKFGGWVVAALLGGAISTVGSTLVGGGNSLRALLAMIGL